MKYKTLWMTLVTLSASSIPALADEGRDFVAAFAAAVKNKDRKAWEAFLAPASRACLNGPGGEMLNRAFASDTRQSVAADSKVWVTRLDAKDVLIAEDMLSYGDRPTHYFQIDLGPPGRATVSLIRYGRLHDGRWQYVLGCPNANGLARAKAAEAPRAAAEADLQARVKALPPAVAAEAKRLIAAGNIMGATAAVANGTGVELSTARGIVRALENKPAGR